MDIELQQQLESEALMKLLLMLLGVILAQVSLIIAFHTSHIIVSVLLLFASVLMIFGGLPKYDIIIGVMVRVAILIHRTEFEVVKETKY
jgi:hypothetical protein